MSISQIEIQERTWNEEDQKYEINYKTVTRDEYAGNFDVFILDEMKRSDIRDYAEEVLDMTEETECNCPTTYVYDYDDHELIEVLEERGYDVIQAQTITEKMKLDELKEQFQIS